MLSLELGFFLDY